MIMTAIEAALTIGKELVVDKDKKAELAFSTMKSLLESRTYVWIDAIVKVSFAAEQIVKGLIRPVISTGVFLYALVNPEILERLHALGAVGDLGIGAILGSAPAWGYSRHQEKKRKKNPDPNDDWDQDD